MWCAEAGMHSIPSSFTVSVRLCMHRGADSAASPSPNWTPKPQGSCSQQRRRGRRVQLPPQLPEWVIGEPAA